MTPKPFSLIVRCWSEPETAAARFQVVRVDTGEVVPMDDSSFLLRISSDETGSVQRCLIRHIASGREVYIQGGQGLKAFISDCLLKDLDASGEMNDEG